PDSRPVLPPPALLSEETPPSDNGLGPTEPRPLDPPSPLAAFLRATGALGGGGFQGAAGYLGGPPALFASYHASWFPDQPVAGQPTNLGFVRQDVLLSLPVWRTPADQLTLRFNVGNENFHTLAVLPDTGQPFPQDLWNIHAGASYSHRFE